jgi:hypothetical protein
LAQVQTPPSNELLQSCSQDNEAQRDVEQAVSSSAPSSQSEIPSQSLLLSMHFGVPLGPPLGQLNLLSGQVMAVQLFSSVPSVQSL